MTDGAAAEPNTDRLLAGFVAIVVVGLCLLPMLRLLAETVLPAHDGTLPLASLWSRSVLKAGMNTVLSSVVASIISVLLGGALALAIGLTDIRHKGALNLLCLLPLLIPPQISALAWIRLLDTGTPVRRAVEAVVGPISGHPLYGAGGVTWVMGLEHAPLVFLVVAAAIRRLPCDLVEAARSAGGRRRQVFAGIVMPLLQPALLAGGALAFVSSIGNFGTPALLGIPGRFTVLTTLIYQRLSGFGPSVLGETAALGLVLAVLAGLGLVFQREAFRRAPVLRSAGPSGPVIELRAARPAVALAVWAVLLMLTVVPLLALLAAALVPALGVPLTFRSATLENFAYVLTEYQPTRRAFLNSTLLSAAAAAITALLALVLAYYAEVRRWRWIRLLDVAADAPYAIPGTVLAIAMILVFLKPLPLVGVSLYGTAWIILAAYLARFLAIVLRPLGAAMRQIDPTLEEAARLAGAGGPRRLFGIVLPALRPAVASGALLVFLTAFSELTVSALLWSQGHETVGVMVFSLQSEGASSQAAAVASLTVFVILALTGLASLAARRMPKGTLPWMP
ncbi:MAG TPA: iron ABC transporter permease [Dongiaceae bacterium]|nr:iron ABC transporter permease [Dongiaceae bacterium]